MDDKETTGCKMKDKNVRIMYYAFLTCFTLFIVIMLAGCINDRYKNIYNYNYQTTIILAEPNQLELGQGE